VEIASGMGFFIKKLMGTCVANNMALFVVWGDQASLQGVTPYYSVGASVWGGVYTIRRRGSGGFSNSVRPAPSPFSDFSVHSLHGYQLVLQRPIEPWEGVLRLALLREPVHDVRRQTLVVAPVQEN